MLSLVQPSVAAQSDRLADARDLLRIVELGRPNWRVLGEILLPLLLAVCLLSVGCNWAAGLLLGVAVSLMLSRYGPRGWPGKR